MNIISSFRYGIGVATSAFSVILFAGCGIFSDEDTLLPGERYSILSLESGLEADPRLQGQQIRLPQIYVNKDWAQPGGNAGNAMGNLAGPSNLVRVWEVKAGEGSSDDGFLTSPPIIADGRAYVLDTEAHLRAFDVATGKRIWVADLVPEDEEESEGFGGGVAFENGVLFVATGFGDLIAIDAAKGEQIWKVAVGIPFRASPTVYNGRVFVETYDNNMVAYDATDGRQLWSHQGVTEAAAILGSTSPAVIDSTVIVPYSSGDLVAIRVDAGTVVWSDQLGSSISNTSLAQLNDIAARPVAEGGEVIVVSHAGSLVSIDLRSGLRNWSRDINGIQTPWVVGDYIYALLSDGELMCINRKNGGVYWVQNLPSYESDGTTPLEWAGPVLVGDRLLLVSSDSQAVMISPYDGEILMETSIEGRGFLAPVVAQETVYILTDNGHLTAYR